eukprot:scaffold287743_cov33-Prasinocladus_malaysianus.AAC.2
MRLSETQPDGSTVLNLLRRRPPSCLSEMPGSAPTLWSRGLSCWPTTSATVKERPTRSEMADSTMVSQHHQVSRQLTHTHLSAPDITFMH